METNKQSKTKQKSKQASRSISIYLWLVGKAGARGRRWPKARATINTKSTFICGSILNNLINA